MLNEEGVEMKGLHPTNDGTQEILDLLDQSLKKKGNPPLVTNRHFITTSKVMYADVRDHYRYGCLGCNHIWDLRADYCLGCIETYKNPWTSILGKGKRRNEDEDNERVDQDGKKVNLNTTPTYADVSKNHLQEYDLFLVEALEQDDDDAISEASVENENEAGNE